MYIYSVIREGKVIEYTYIVTAPQSKTININLKQINR